MAYHTMVEADHIYEYQEEEAILMNENDPESCVLVNCLPELLMNKMRKHIQQEKSY